MFLYLKRENFDFSNIKKKDIDVQFKSKELKVILRGHVIIDDRLQNYIDPDKCTWYLNSVAIPIQKPNSVLQSSDFTNLEKEKKIMQYTLCISLSKKYPTGAYWHSIIPSDRVVMMPNFFK